MSTLQGKKDITPQAIRKTFKILGLDNPIMRKHFNSLSQFEEKRDRENEMVNLITVDNTLEQKGGDKNA